jgi:hypothetical protein
MAAQHEKLHPDNGRAGGQWVWLGGLVGMGRPGILTASANGHAGERKQAGDWGRTGSLTDRWVLVARSGSGSNGSVS